MSKAKTKPRTSRELKLKPDTQFKKTLRKVAVQVSRELKEEKLRRRPIDKLLRNIVN
jgi:hypothetical protein